MHAVVAFAKPFRMPDFFLISGLFLALVIDRDWRTYLDRKVVHFAYFYVLWVTIQFAFKAPMMAPSQGWPASRRCSTSNPSSSRSARCGSSTCCRSSSSSPRRRARVPPVVIWLIAAALEIAPIDDRLDGDRRVRRPLRLFLHRLHAGAAHFPRSRRPCRRSPCGGSPGWSLWAVVNGLLVAWPAMPTWPFVSLALGLVGAAAVVSIVGADGASSSLFRPLRYCGAELHRHLPRLLPADGGDAHRADQDRHRRRRRH